MDGHSQMAFIRAYIYVSSTLAKDTLEMTTFTKSISIIP